MLWLCVIRTGDIDKGDALLKLPSLAQLFHQYYKLVDRIDARLTPRPPLEVTVPGPLTTGTLPRVVVAMADAVEQVFPEQDVSVKLPGNTQFPPEMVRSVGTHAARSDQVDLVGSSGGSMLFKAAEPSDDGHAQASE